MAIAGGAKTNSIACTSPVMKPGNGPSARSAYTKAPPALGMAQASSV